MGPNRPLYRKVDMEIAHRRKKGLDADLIRQQLKHFEHLVKVLPMEDEKELFQLIILGLTQLNTTLLAERTLIHAQDCPQLRKSYI
jgi:hypothetical protein